MKVFITIFTAVLIASISISAAKKRIKIHTTGLVKSVWVQNLQY